MPFTTHEIEVIEFGFHEIELPECESFSLTYVDDCFVFSWTTPTDRNGCVTGSTLQAVIDAAIRHQEAFDKTGDELTQSMRQGAEEADVRPIRGPEPVAEYLEVTAINDLKAKRRARLESRHNAHDLMNIKAWHPETDRKPTFTCPSCGGSEWTNVGNDRRSCANGQNWDGSIIRDGCGFQWPKSEDWMVFE